MLKIRIIGFTAALFLMACSPEEHTYEPLINEKLPFKIPSNFKNPGVSIQYNLERNPPTQKGFELGRKLFYEGRLSRNGIVSCGFCHIQPYAFTHHGHQFSHGVAGRIGSRNAPTIQNAAFMSAFAWDGAAFNLDLFYQIPLLNPLEMDNETLDDFLDKLKADKEYPKLFAAAFEDGKISFNNISKALSQFLVMMISANSKYDKYVRHEQGVTFTAQEEKGKKLFEVKCAACHATDLFTDGSFRNNGLPPYPGLDDKGLAGVSFDKDDQYKFKVPSLRNVAVTKPYMHDGRFGSLESVLDFYDHKVKNSPNLDSILIREDGTLGIKIKEDEKKALIAFLKTLTDETYLTDERFSEESAIENIKPVFPK